MPLPLDPSAQAARILVVDDDPTVLDVLINYLLAANYYVRAAKSGIEGFDILLKEKFDVLILDLMLPGIDGLELFRRVREKGISTPVIMLTAKTDEADRILGLEMGADDYISKPFSPRELVLRVKTVLRRSLALKEAVLMEAQTQKHILVDGDLELDANGRTLHKAGRPIQLTLREFDLLAYFMSHPGQLFTRDELMSAVWGWDYGDPSTVTVHVRRLRAKIEHNEQEPRHLKTVWGRGYRWDSCGL